MTGSVSAAFRCSVASAALEEPLAGTGSHVRAFLLVEEPGPWGVQAVRDSRLPEEVKQRLGSLQSEHGVRPLLIRDHARRRPATRRVFAAFVGAAGCWVETAELSDVRDLLALDLTGLGEGLSVGLEPYDGQLYCVCTHGKHDVCCAETGRPLCRALHEEVGDAAWEVSHIGGDRFAANVLVLPEGLYYGRLQPGHAADLVAAHRAGSLDLDHLRGRAAYPFAVQAAEIYLRRHLGLTGAAALPVTSRGRDGRETLAGFRVGDQLWEVRVATTRSEPRQLTCRALAPGVGLSQHLVEVRPA